MQDPASDLPRTPLLSTSVNKPLGRGSRYRIGPPPGAHRNLLRDLAEGHYSPFILRNAASNSSGLTCI
jgi:hypothetical protein